MTANRTLWLQLHAGVAGDMVLGALLDAGASLDAVRSTLERLDVPGWSLDIESTDRCGVAASRAIVTVEDDGTARSLSEILELLERAELPDRVARRSKRTFLRLGEVEAAIHGSSVEAVHLHEAGGHDAIVDVVGTMAALEDLGIDEIRCSKIGLGAGSIRSAHGTLPGPAPATLALLQGHQTLGLDAEMETATPTGAAIVAALVAHVGLPMRGGELIATGFGAGTADPPGRANVVGAVIVDAHRSSTELVGVIETNLDDVTGEQLGQAISFLLDAGALDAWVTPILMKKDRPAWALSVLCHPADVERLVAEVQRHTGTLGARIRLQERSVVAREMTELNLDGDVIRIKVSPHRRKPEADDIEQVAARRGSTFKDVAADAARRLDEGPIESAADPGS